MTLVETVPGALVLIAAGVYQFTPLKQTCLRQCRSPVEFLTRRKRSGASGAFLMGLEHAVYCIGCCWFVMALLFVGGIMNLFWIVGLTLFVVLEKLSPYGEMIGKSAGIMLIGWGAYVISTSL
jgi:predicted metal-binding membrane protein